MIAENRTGINRKALGIGVLCYAVWGVLPLYWHLLEDWNPLFILACRILFSAVFMLLLLLCLGKIRQVFDVLRNRSAMKWLLPASIVITFNWGIYIWAVNSGRILDASLGYYMNPLVVFALGYFIFHEKSGPLAWAACAMAAVGVTFTTVLSGVVPFAAIALALSFAVYGMLKKAARVDGMVSIAVETLLMTPPALLFLLLSPISRGALAAVTPGAALLLIGAGAVTSVPLALYTRGVNDLPFTTMGFLQFIAPTFQLIIGLTVFKESLRISAVIAFAVIWAGLILYMADLFLKERKSRTLNNRS